MRSLDHLLSAVGQEAKYGPVRRLAQRKRPNKVHFAGIEALLRQSAAALTSRGEGLNISPLLVGRTGQGADWAMPAYSF
ncbi:MAG TPA: hypothetical protein VHS81_15180 [Caulobacteraceae bacterium]|nr:hypothetical protein [Caulobacteraceae bacterium]